MLFWRKLNGFFSKFGYLTTTHKRIHVPNFAWFWSPIGYVCKIFCWGPSGPQIKAVFGKLQHLYLLWLNVCKRFIWVSRPAVLWSRGRTDRQCARRLWAELVEPQTQLTVERGTVRKNKQDIPPDMQQNPGKHEYSSMFGFAGQLTLVSYVPKKNRAVILLSSMHHDTAIEGEMKKPEIINHYNSHKGGVDNLDHLVGIYSVKRKCNRWPKVLFFNMVDVAAVASYVIWLCNFPNWRIKKRCTRRRIFLMELGEFLVEDLLQERLNNPRALQKSVKAAFVELGSLICAITQLKVLQQQRNDATFVQEMQIVKFAKSALHVATVHVQIIQLPVLCVMSACRSAWLTYILLALYSVYFFVTSTSRFLWGPHGPRWTFCFSVLYSTK